MSIPRSLTNEDIEHPQELEVLDKPLRTLTLRAHKGWGPERIEDIVRVEFSPGDIRVVAAEDTPALRGVVDEIRGLIWKGARSLDPSFLIPMLGLIAFVLLLYVAQGPRGEVPSEILWLGIPIMAVAFWVGVRVSKRAFSTIVPAYRDQNPSFWKRNRDQLVIALISAGVGAIASAIAVLVVNGD